jgi:hypothetical protein
MKATAFFLGGPADGQYEEITFDGVPPRDLNVVMACPEVSLSLASPADPFAHIHRYQLGRPPELHGGPLTYFYGGPA